MKKIQGILLLLIFICLATALLDENNAFTTPYNMQNLLRRTSLFGVLSIGVAFVIITGGIDLSIGSVVGLIGVLMPILLVDNQIPVGWSLLIVMLVALAIGLTHGLLITRMRLQPFVVTLCGLLIYRGLARRLAADQTKGFGAQFDSSLRLLATSKPCSVAFVLLVSGLLMALAGVLVAFWRRRESVTRWLPPALIAAAGLVVALVGSARYWNGWEYRSTGMNVVLAGWEFESWEVVVSDAARTRPQQLLQLLCWPALAAALVATVLGLRADASRVWRPGLALLLGVGALAAAIGVAGQPPDWFWPNPAWAQRWKMLVVFASLGVLMMAVAWFVRSVDRAGGPLARAALFGAGFGAIGWLFGQTPLAETLLPAPFFIMVLIGAAAAFFLNLTIYGRYLLALGRNEEAARYSGIQTRRMTTLAYVICGLTTGVGAILMALDGNSVQPSGHGNFYELYAIAAAVLGGCSLRGGEGTILGVIIGTAVMRVLYNSINLLGIPTDLEFAIIGVVILVGVIVDETVKRLAARRRAASERAAGSV